MIGFFKMSRRGAAQAVLPLFLLSFGMSVIGCGGDKAGGEVDPIGASIEVYPPKGGQGTQMEVSFDASRSSFTFTGTTLDFGAGIVVDEVHVDDGFSARADITIEPDAELGLRDLVVHVDGLEKTLGAAFEVVSQSFSVDPDAAKIGETVEITMLGHNTEWVGGLTWPNFGDGIEVDAFTVLSSTLAQATISVDTAAPPGWRNVVMDNGGGDLVVNYDGFKVDRVALAAEFEPGEAEQGDTVEFTVYARGTDFTGGEAYISFMDRFGDNPDIVVDSVTVLDAENLYGQMTLSNAAVLGERDVQIQAGPETIIIPDAFEVVGGDWNLEEVAISLSFTVVRQRDNTSCDLAERVSAGVTFYIPLDPPCPVPAGGGEPGPQLGGPEPYDNNGAWGIPMSDGGGGEHDCPYPTTIPAGDYVWLESDANTITMEKVEDPASGTVYYVAKDLTIDDYVVDNWYDLHTQGQEDGIGEYLLEDVQPTVPANWEWTSPIMCENFTQDRAQDQPFTWTPAETYPDAIFWVSIGMPPNDLINMSEEGYIGYAATIPWDDGDHHFATDELAALGAQPVTHYAYSYIEGPPFGLPESIYQENTAPSYILLTQYMILE
jgi:hypothetical protein